MIFFCYGIFVLILKCIGFIQRKYIRQKNLVECEEIDLWIKVLVFKFNYLCLMMEDRFEFLKLFLDFFMYVVVGVFYCLLNI